MAFVKSNWIRSRNEKTPRGRLRKRWIDVVENDLEGLRGMERYSAGLKISGTIWLWRRKLLENGVEKPEEEEEEEEIESYAFLIIN